MVQEVLLLLKALLITVLVLVLAYWFTRHMAGRMAGRMAGGSRVRGRCITVLEQVSVGKESKLLLARLGDRLYFLAMTPGGITILREVTEEEAASWTGPESSPAETPDSFAQAIRRVLEKRKK